MKKTIIVCFIVCALTAIFYLYRHNGSTQIFACNNTKTPSTGLGLSGIEKGYPEFQTTENCGELVKHKSISLMYCERYEEPIWVSYILTKKEVETEEKLERYKNFKKDPLVKTGSAITSDYSNSGYDRGHLAPNADMNWDQQSMEECFFMSNITPQKPEFNQGIWKTLEESVRRWAAKYDSLYIVTGPDLKDISEYIGKKNKIGVPKSFYKVILDAKGPQYSGIAFYIPNEKSDQSIFDYSMSIQELEKKLGCNFFPQLNPKLMEKVEEQLEVEEWKK